MAASTGMLKLPSLPGDGPCRGGRRFTTGSSMPDAKSTRPFSFTGMSRADLSQAQLDYAERVLYPLLEDLVGEAVGAMPGHLAAHLTRWLLLRLNVPQSVCNPVLAWLKLPQPTSDPSPSETKETLVARPVPAEPKPDGAHGLDLDDIHYSVPSPGPAEPKLDVAQGGGGAIATQTAQTLPTCMSSDEEDDEVVVNSILPDLPQNLRSELIGVAPVLAPKPPTTPAGKPSRKPSILKRISTKDGAKFNSEDDNEKPSSECEMQVKAVDTGAADKGKGPKRKVSISAAQCGKEAEENPQKRDSIGLGKQRLRRGRAVSIFRPPPAVPVEETLELFKKTPMFKDLCQDDLESLACIAQVKTFDADEDVVRFGEKHKEFHVVHSGEGRVSVPTLKGVVKAGDSFGENALTKTHLLATSTISATGSENSTFVTLAVSHKDLEDLGLLGKLRTRREGMAFNFVKRTATMGADANPRKARRGTPAEITPVVSQQAGTEKDPEDRHLIMQALRSNAHFTDWLALSERQLEAMTDMMRLTTIEAGQHVITSGEQGHTFYIVNDGMLDILKEDARANEVIAGNLRIGDSFGELALLYNCPRKATIRASRQCQLWVLNRDRFRQVMRLKSEARITEYAHLIDMVPIFKEQLSTDDKETMASALEEAFFLKDEQIVTQGEDGDTFYMVFEGCCEVRVNGISKGILEKGRYFGERALLTNEPRAATVVCASETATLLSLDSQAFTFLLGEHLQEVLPDEEASRRRGSTGPRPAPENQRRGSAEPDLGQVPLIELVMSQAGITKSEPTLVPWENLEPVGALGYGAFGTVTLQRDKATQTMYALKALSKGYIKQERLQEHVLNEKRTLQMLDSEFLVLQYCTYRDAQYVYFLLEPALGGELFEVYDQHLDMFHSEPHARFYAVCATLGLEHLHARKIVYRDLKLENILLKHDGFAILTDMGLAKVIIGKTFTVCGTADYFAPETLRQTGHNRAVDWWALGIMIYIMMSGRSPFDAEDVMQIYKNIVKGFKNHVFPENLSEHLTSLIKGICRKKPEERLPMWPGGIKNLEAHDWFTPLPFAKVEKHTCDPPYKPPEPDFDHFARKLAAGPPADLQFVSNDATTDNDWDIDFQ